MTSFEHLCVSNYWQLDGLFNRLFRQAAKKTLKFSMAPLVIGEILLTLTRGQWYITILSMLMYTIPIARIARLFVLCGGDGDPDKRWPRLWRVACQHQAIAWTNVKLRKLASNPVKLHRKFAKHTGEMYDLWSDWVNGLAHWDRDNMADILQTAFCSSFFNNSVVS